MEGQDFFLSKVLINLEKGARKTEKDEHTEKYCLPSKGRRH